MTHTLSICQSEKGALEKDIAKAISDCLNKNLDKSILFLVSGGSALRMLDYIDPKSLTPNVTVSLLDERSDGSNLSALKKTNFHKLINFVPIGFDIRHDTKTPKLSTV